MRPTFLGFETSKRGLMVNQKALDIVGNNVSNLGVTGYTRQRVDQVSISSHGMSARYAPKAYMLAGQGSDVKGVAQIRDPYLDKRFRQENSDVGFYNKMTEIMTDTEDALDEWSSSGIKDAVAKMLEAVKNLSGDINPTNANVVRTAAKSMTQVLHQYDVKLNNIVGQQQYDLEMNVEQVNSLLSRIASLNENISKDCYAKDSATGTYYGPNELLDQRNVLLDELSGYGDIQIETMADSTVNVKMGGHEVITGKKAETMSYTKNIDNTVSVTWQSTGKNVSTTSGAILATTNMINGRGEKAAKNENYERGIPYYKDKIDLFATTVGQAFNNVIPSFDADGKPNMSNGSPVYQQLFAFDQTKNAAAGISISDKWNENADYIMTPTNPEGKQDNTYYLNMIKLLDGPLKFGSFTGSMNEFVKDYGSTLQEDKKFNESRLKATAAIADTVLDNISTVSGVSMDEEGAEMMAYTKAYGAMSRIMTAMDEALDTLINKTGLVGR